MHVPNEQKVSHHGEICMYNLGFDFELSISMSLCLDDEMGVPRRAHACEDNIFLFSVKCTQRVKA